MVMSFGSFLTEKIAREIEKLQGFVFKNLAQTIFNAEYIGWSSSLNHVGSPSFSNLKYDVFTNSTDIDTTNSDIDDWPVFAAALMDNHDDSSIDANIWSTSGSGISESTTKITLSRSGGAGFTSSATADQVNAVDLNSDGAILFVKVGNLSATYSNGIATARIRIVDQSGNAVDIASRNHNQGNLTTTTMYRININTGNNTMGISTDITATGDTGTDISSLVDSDVWDFEIHISASASGGTATVSASVFFERYIDGAAESDDFISSATTSSNTIKKAILIINEYEGTGTSASYFLSADNGSNYEEVTPEVMHTFSNTGTQLKLKVTLNSTTTEIRLINEYAIIWNV